MSPYQGLYGKLPPLLIPYPQGTSKVATVDELLVERDVLLRRLKENLTIARHRMEMKANRKRREVEFEPGSKVFVKLQPYRQITLAKRLSNKLSKRYYGPFEVVERIGKVAYRLAQPETSQIHPVFHVSILKPYTGVDDVAITPLPEEEEEGQPLEQPLAIGGSRVVLRNGQVAQQVLVQWTGGSPEEATWEWVDEFRVAYPDYHLEDKVISEERENVTPVHERRKSRRNTNKPNWQKDYVMG